MHLVNLHIILDLDIVHRLRRDQHVLPAYRRSGSVNHHPHTDITIDLIHENVEFIETADWTAHSLPKRKQQTYGGKRLLATRKSFGLTATTTFSGCIWLDFDFQRAVFVFDFEVTAEIAVA